MDQLPDSRFDPFVIYDKKFLVWWGILLFLFRLASRRQLDYNLRDMDTHVLANLNRLAGTNQGSLPVHKTLNHFLGHVGSDPMGHLRTLLIRRLIRMKALDACRMMGRFVVALDGTGCLVFKRRHCAHCLVQKHDNATYYFHPVLEAKLVDTRGFALSMATEFIENPIPFSEDSDYEKLKQDCESKAFHRLAPVLKRYFARTPICISGDSLHACGPAIETCEENHWSYVFTFKPGALPSVWEDFQGLLELCPENKLHIELPDGTIQDYRWVNGISYRDSNHRHHIFDAIICEETVDNQKTTFSWITNIRVTEKNVIRISVEGGRVRSKIENQGFNIQKNSGFNLEHAYSFDRENLKAFYYLLQIAHIMLQMVEMGSLLKDIARRHGIIPPSAGLKLFGSLGNISRRLLECFRYFLIRDDAYDPLEAARIQIRLDSS